MNCGLGNRVVAVDGPARGVLGDVVAGARFIRRLSDNSLHASWIVAFDSPIDWGTGASPNALDAHEGLYPDAWLRPVRGDGAIPTPSIVSFLEWLSR